MAGRRKKRSPDAHLVSTRISDQGGEMLEKKAAASALTVAAYVRQLLYRHLGLIEGDNSNG